MRLCWIKLVYFGSGRSSVINLSDQVTEPTIGFGLDSVSFGNGFGQVGVGNSTQSTTLLPSVNVPLPRALQVSASS